MQKLKEKLLSLGIVEDNEYLDFYCALIENNRDTKREKYKTQKHHIIPKWFYKHNNLEVDNSKENLVNLLYKDHILAHYYLCLCSPKSKTDYLLFNSNSFIHMYASLKKHFIYKDIYSVTISEEELKHYQEIYESFCKLDAKLKVGKESPTKGKISIVKEGKIKYIDKEKLNEYINLGWIKGGLPLSDEHKNINREYMKNRIVSKNTRDKLSSSKKGKPSPNKGKKGKPLTKEHKESISNYMKNSKFIHKDGVVKRVPNEFILDYLNNGWSLGRGDIMSKLNKDNKGIKIKCLTTNKLYSSLRECSLDLNIPKHKLVKFIKHNSIFNLNGYEFTINKNLTYI